MSEDSQLVPYVSRAMLREAMKAELHTIPGFGTLHDILVDRAFIALDLLEDQEAAQAMSKEERKSRGLDDPEAWYVYRAHNATFLKVIELLMAEGRLFVKEDLYRRNLAREVAHIISEEVGDEDAKRRIVQRLRRWAVSGRTE